MKPTDFSVSFNVRCSWPPQPLDDSLCRTVKDFICWLHSDRTQGPEVPSASS